MLNHRYNAATGELRIVSERYPEREENRLAILETIHALVAEGRRVYPSEAEDAPSTAQAAAA